MATKRILSQADFNVPEWLEFFMSIVVVLGYFFAFTALFFSPNAGSVTLGLDKFILNPKKKVKRYSASTLPINDDTSIHIDTIQTTRFIISRTILHVEIMNGEETEDFGLFLRNKKKYQQYLDVLESWYTHGYKIKEYDQLGNRTFKLNRGKNYADLQKIKQEYGIEW